MVITTKVKKDFKEIKRIIRKYYEQSYTNKLDVKWTSS